MLLNKRTNGAELIYINILISKFFICFLNIDFNIPNQLFSFVYKLPIFLSYNYWSVLKLFINTNINLEETIIQSKLNNKNKLN